MFQIFNKRKEERGFTLIELLVVIAIIGILASIVLVSMGSAREKARDARRQSDIRQIGIAMEMDYDDNQAYIATSSMPTAIGSYLDPVPTDPQGSSYGWVDNSSTSSDYCVSAVLEKSCTNTCYFISDSKGTREVDAATTTCSF